LKHRNARTRNTLIYVTTILCSIAYIIFGNIITTQDLVYTSSDSDGYYLKAKVTDIVEETFAEDMFGDNDGYDITFTAKILSGVNKGKTLTATKTYDSFVDTEENKLDVGDKVLIFSTDLETNATWYFVAYIRSDYLIAICALFLALLIVFGHRKGLNTVVSLVFTCLAIFAVFIPAILSGQNIYIWSVVTCLFIIVMSLLIINGANMKTWAAVIGCIGGIMVAGVMTAFLDSLLKITGIVSEESVYLVELNSTNPINLKAIVFAGILIGAIGAVMDVAMSISSSLYELNEQMYHPSFGQLWKSGLNIGRDMMGTMSNTLILAYIGSSLSLVLLMVAYNTPMIYLFNRELIVVEILQALIGSFGLLFTIPFTSLIASRLYRK
jgi:uncharacterized membrane protein